MEVYSFIFRHVVSPRWKVQLRVGWVYSPPRLFIRGKGGGNVCQGVACDCRRVFGRKEGRGVGKYEGRIQISLLGRRTRGGIEKVFGARQQETSKSVPFPPPEYKWNVLRTGDCIVFLSIHTNLHERYSCSIKRKKKKKERKGKRKDCCVPWIVHCKNWISEGGLVKILSVWLLLFYFNLIWRKKL